MAKKKTTRKKAPSKAAIKSCAQTRGGKTPLKTLPLFVRGRDGVWRSPAFVGVMASSRSETPQLTLVEGEPEEKEKGEAGETSSTSGTSRCSKKTTSKKVATSRKGGDKSAAGAADGDAARGPFTVVTKTGDISQKVVVPTEEAIAYEAAAKALGSNHGIFLHQALPLSVITGLSNTGTYFLAPGVLEGTSSLTGYIALTRALLRGNLGLIAHYVGGRGGFTPCAIVPVRRPDDGVGLEMRQLPQAGSLYSIEDVVDLSVVGRTNAPQDVNQAADAWLESIAANSVDSRLLEDPTIVLLRALRDRAFDSGAIPTADSTFPDGSLVDIFGA